MRVLRIAFVTALLLSPIHPRPLHALCAATSFEWQIENATLIFVGTLRAATCVRTPQTIVTRYCFGHLRCLKGKASNDSLVLIQDGGTVDGMTIWSEHSVPFEVGTRYIVFADSGYWGRPRDYSPMLCGLSPFALLPDSGSARPVVHRRGSTMLAFDGVHMVFLSRPRKPGTGPWRIDADGTQHPPSPPPRVALEEALRASDLELEGRLRGLSDPEARKARERVRVLSLDPHQDPGTRVTEEEFLTALKTVIDRVSRTAE